MVKETHNSVNHLTRKLKEDGNLPPELSLEDTLLVQLSRLILVPEVLETVKEMIHNEIDWNLFLEGARRHRLSGFIYHHYLTHKLPMPLDIVSCVSKDAFVNQVRALILLREINRISKSLTGIDGPVVLLKGPVLIHQVYDSASIRPFNDIDLLTFREFIPQVEKSLYRAGYAHVINDPIGGRIRHMTPAEIESAQGAIHRPVLTKVDDSLTNIGPSLDIHHTDLKLGNFGFNSIIENSEHLPAVGPGLRVPRIDDLVIYSVYHFYHHFHLGNFPLLSNNGALRYLTDIYACLRVYLHNSGNWASLLKRADEISAKEILTYGLFYLNLVYGKGTIPEEIMESLLGQKEFEVPLRGNTTVSVDSLHELLKLEIHTATKNIGPALWLFQPEKIPEMLFNELKDWKARGKVCPTVSCLRIKSDSIVDDKPSDTSWRIAEDLSVDEESVDPKQFFLTHVINGVWPSQGGVRAYIRLLWSNKYLFLRANVSAGIISYVGPKYAEKGEIVRFYISGSTDEGALINRIGVSIGQDGRFVPTLWPSQEEPYRDIQIESLRIAVCARSNSYYLDVSIPWEALNIAPSSNLHLGFDAEITHRASSMDVETALAWAGGRFLRGVYPDLHGTVILVDE